MMSVCEVNARSGTRRNTGNLSSDDYLKKLPRESLTIPSTDLVHYASKSFAMLDCVKSILWDSKLSE